MFLRTVKVKRPGGRVDEYIRLVESVWREGRPEHRIVAHLGRKDLLAPQAATLLRMLTGDKASVSDAAHVDAVGAWDWGPVLVARHLWRELGLEQTVDALARDRGALADRAVALVASRVCEPTSEHGMARWLETTYVCDRSGQRWWPAWRDEAERLASRRPRVRVQDRQLRQWYGTLDWLVRHKPQLEQELFGRLLTLFALNVDLVFYDLTSTYFEGNGPTGLAKHGHSRDGKPRNRQVLVGVVMIDGSPIAHHVFEGNRRDAPTVTEAVSDLQGGLRLRRVAFGRVRWQVRRRNAACAGENRRGGRPDPRAHPWVPLLRLDPDEGDVSVCGAPGASRAREGARGDVSDPNRRAALITRRSGDGLQRTQRGRTRLWRAQGCDRDAAHLSPQGRPRARPHLCGLPRVSP